MQVAVKCLIVQGQVGPRLYQLFAVPCYFGIKILQSINSSQFLKTEKTRK